MGVRKLMRTRYHNTAARVLDRAADYVDQGWTQGANARNADGDSWAPDSPDATCWCAMGGIKAALADLVNSKTPDQHKWCTVFDAALRGVHAETGIGSVSVWNDTDGQTAGGVAGGLRRSALRLRTRALFGRVFPERVLHDDGGAPYCRSCVETLPGQCYTEHVPGDGDAWWCINCGCALTDAADAAGEGDDC